MDAMKKATENPITERWLADRMKMESIEQRAKDFVEKDWEGEWRRTVGADMSVREQGGLPANEDEASAAR